MQIGYSVAMAPLNFAPLRAIPAARGTSDSSRARGGSRKIGDMDIELAPGVSAPDTAVRLQFARSGGPGGQNVNKLNTKAELWVRLDAIQGLSYNALARLRAMAGRRVTSEGEIHIVSETERRQ